MKRFAIHLPFALCLAIALTGALGADELLIKDRRPFGKTIRTRMPPQIVIEAIQKDFNAVGPRWDTRWRTFIVEDDPQRDEYVIVARSAERPWALAVFKEDCPKPENFEVLKSQVQEGGSPVRLDALIGVKKKRSFFRYVIQIYDPMYPFWKNPCYGWNLPPGKSPDPFYKENYNMEVYSENLREKVYELVSSYSDWRPPKRVQKIAAMKGAGYELIGGDADELLSDDERKLSIVEQQKLLEKYRKQREKEEKKRKKEKKKED